MRFRRRGRLSGRQHPVAPLAAAGEGVGGLRLRARAVALALAIIAVVVLRRLRRLAPAAARDFVAPQDLARLFGLTVRAAVARALGGEGLDDVLRVLRHTDADADALLAGGAARVPAARGLVQEQLLEGSTDRASRHGRGEDERQKRESEGEAHRHLV